MIAYCISGLYSDCTDSLGDEELAEQLPKMDARIAEALVRKWQSIKSQAFGPDHSLGKLQEVLEILLFPIKLEVITTLFENLVGPCHL